MSASARQRICSVSAVFLLAVVLGLGLANVSVRPPPASAQPAGPVLAGDALVAALRRGGYVILIRHAATDMAQQDRDPDPNLSNCDLQRNLTDAGRAQARTIGDGLRAIGVPVSAIASSDYCRALETARLVFGEPVKAPDIRDFDAMTAPRALQDERGAALKGRLAKAPTAGTNSIIVTHRPVIAAVTGVSPDEGDSLIVLPNATGGFTVVARVAAAEWAALAQQRPRTLPNTGDGSCADSDDCE